MSSYNLFIKSLQENIFQKERLLKISLLFITTCFIIVFAFFCFFSSGLDEDGSFNLLHLLMFDKIRINETNRIFFDLFYSIPVFAVFSFFPSSSFSFITQVYSFSLIYIHILTFIFCFLILPKNKKIFIFFPLFSFLTGQFVLLSISVSVAFSVSSYLWLMAFMIHYGDLSKKSHKLLFFILPFPLILSHEMMSYLSWFLIVLYLFKLQSFQKSNQPFKSFFIAFFIAFFILVSFLNLYLIFWTEGMHNLIQFKNSLIFFKFLFSFEAVQFNLCLFMAFLLKIGLFLELFKRSFYFQTFLVLFLLMSFCIFLFLPFSVFQEVFFTSSYLSRVYPPIISLPFCLVMWWLAELKQIELQNLSKKFLWSCCILSLFFTIYRIKSDLKYYNYRQNFSKQLEKCEGLIPLSSFKNKYSKSQYFWKITAESLIIPQKKSIKTILFHDLCEKECGENSKLNGSCGFSCKGWFDLPDAFSKEFFRENSFFNFQPLFNNWEKKKNSCSNL